MTDSLNPASLQKLHELDERARRVPGALFDHLDLTGRYTGKRGKACSRVTTSLADGAESFGGHLGHPCKKRGSGGFIDFAAAPAVVCKSLNAPLKTLASCLAADKFAAGFVMARAVLGNRGPVFHRFNVHSNSPKSKGAEAPERLDAFHVVGLITGNLGFPNRLHLVLGRNAIVHPHAAGASFGVHGVLHHLVLLAHLSISVPDDTLLTHNVHIVKHKVRTNDDLLREAA